ncbi:unnamed protein product [Cyprideis torosa]|uniref:Queuine tRNA-ribosyltransferase catalytic subunit 1 n=1 Tax=Cyprideis torosa TaxID=163714 RepID=A0A7R8WPC4_9CRUS|nr:unnamed protein product [Cyprideis torosa]CAG0901643.1 unnamed protein product [Cyprideis torosa]
MAADEPGHQVHVINIDIQDNHEEATLGGFLICELATILTSCEDLDNDIDEALQEFEIKRVIICAVCVFDMSVSVANKVKHPLQFTVLAQCPTTKARVGKMVLPHSEVDTPVFMPVGTQGTMKGLLPQEIEATGSKLILGNTYHLGHRPGSSLIAAQGGLHRFMKWDHGLLTDSGGFQMVSLLKLAEITEEGVRFQSPYDGSASVLTPERSIEIQNEIGADIIMQLDDVVSSTCPDRDRVEEAMHRTVRWLDRCLEAHQRKADQSLFPIVQGGLHEGLRKQCVEELLKRDVSGYAIGGLSGGESKDQFWRMVQVSTDLLPKDKPRYLMGVGVAVDLVVCVALGCDMFDCVFPTRTARFGCALVDEGQLNLSKSKFQKDFRPIDDSCPCSTCSRHSRAFLHQIATHETSACHLLSVHNITFQMRLMRRMAEAIRTRSFPEFIQQFMLKVFPEKDYPTWISDSLRAVGVTLVN